ncbi:MAG: thioredoxin family protein, partial [Nanoarchaeota archaeon]
GEIEIEGSTGVIEEGYADCGNDNDCLEEALRLCEPAVLKLNENFAKIEGLEGEACILEVSFMGADMVCKIKDYATFRFEGRDLFQYCEGKGREVLKMFEAKITTSADWTLADCEGMIDSDKKERCYMAVASTTGDGSLCAKITDINIRENSCYFSIAWNIKDSSLCAKISDKNRRDNCYEGVAVALKDADICEQLLDSESEDRSPSTRFSEILCYNKVAIAAQDKSICERITKDDDDTRCYCKERTMELIGDDCYCEEITRDNNRAKCYAAVAKDASLCETITDEFTKDSCYSGVAQETKDSSLCERITTGQKDGCYYNLHDRSVCDKIINDQMREHCYGDTESIKSAPPEEKTITDEEAPTQTATGTTARVRRTIDGNVLYFYNNNCPHCERQGPIITEIEKNLGGLIKVERLDTEKESEIFAKYNINAVPSMVYIGSDGCTRIKMGYTEYDELKEWIYSDECAGGVS